MEILIAVVIFTIGTVFGSFFTLAVYRIPLNKDITHERSFCPTCNHRLNFWDLIPVWSYVFLKGKCRYCKEKVRPRYLILEVTSGIVFLVQYLLLRISIEDITYLCLGIDNNNIINKFIYFIFFVCFYITNAIIIGINKENKVIEKRVLIFGIITQCIYLAYLFINEKVLIINIVAILLVILLILINKKINNKILNVLGLIVYEISFLGMVKSIYFAIITLLIFLINFIICKIKKESINSEKMGFVIGICAIGMQLILDYFI